MALTKTVKLGGGKLVGPSLGIFPVFDPASVKRATPVGPTLPTVQNVQPGGPPYDPTADPAYQKIAGQYAAMSQEERDAMNTAIANARLYYGSETDPLSLYGRNKEAYVMRDRSLQNALNARGMFRSGETGYELNQSRLGYLRDKLDLGYKLEDYINGLLAGFAKAERQRQIDLGEWAWKIAQEHANQPAPPILRDPGHPPTVADIIREMPVTTFPTSRLRKNPVPGKGPVPA